jgi:hypothetical protein
MTAFSSRKGAAAFPTESLSCFLAQAKLLMAMQFFIMEHSFSLCLTGNV